MVHKHHGKSSANFLDSSEILNELNLNGNETFMDAGCGDGYIALKALKDYLPEGIVYAVDSYDESIKSLEEYKKENKIENLINIEADLTKRIPIEDSLVDVVFMLNVFHGFSKDNYDEVIGELTRIIKNDGKIAIMDFKPFDMPIGPPTDIRISSKKIEEIFNTYGFEKCYLNEEIGAEFPQGKSHYLIIFKRSNFT